MANNNNLLFYWIGEIISLVEKYDELIEYLPEEDGIVELSPEQTDKAWAISVELFMILSHPIMRQWLTSQYAEIRKKPTGE